MLLCFPVPAILPRAQRTLLGRNSTSWMHGVMERASEQLNQVIHAALKSEDLHDPRPQINENLDEEAAKRKQEDEVKDAEAREQLKALQQLGKDLPEEVLAPGDVIFYRDPALGYDPFCNLLLFQSGLRTPLHSLWSLINPSLLPSLCRRTTTNR